MMGGRLGKNSLSRRNKVLKRFLVGITDELNRSRIFANTSLDFLKSTSSQHIGNRWFKVNLHVHGSGNDPEEVVRVAAREQVDLLAVTDHQTFEFYKGIASAARHSEHNITVLPGIEITSPEGCHLLAIFPQSFGKDKQQQFYGLMEMPNVGDTRQPARTPLSKILTTVDDLGGIIVVPHPMSEKFGLLDSARKLGIREEWLDSGHIRLMQCQEEDVKFVDFDDEQNFVNRWVLATAGGKHIAESAYCLAPFNKSDAHRPDEVAEGCSWFRMNEASIEGLKQVACEPRTRISRVKPDAELHDCIIAARVKGGYCDEQLFQFSPNLSCIIGENHAGKSAVFDFLRFALGEDATADEVSRRRLLQRLSNILGENGVVEVCVKKNGCCFLVTRKFVPKFEFEPGKRVVSGVSENASAYQANENGDALIPAKDFSFPIEVYEQGRISRLREDLSRQMEMLDEFANLDDLKAEASSLVLRIRESAEEIQPLLERRDSLKSELASLPTLKKELEEKAAYLPDDEEQQRWTESRSVAESISQSFEQLQESIDSIEIGEETDEELTSLQMLFGQTAPTLPSDEDIVRVALLREWQATLSDVIKTINEAKERLVAKVREGAAKSAEFETIWQKEVETQEAELAEHLAEIDVTSPDELISRVGKLRVHVKKLKESTKPALEQVLDTILEKQRKHTSLVKSLAEVRERITAIRIGKAAELTAELEGNIRIEVLPRNDAREYRTLLEKLVDEVSSKSLAIRRKDEQLAAVCAKVGPIELANALANGGLVDFGDGHLSLSDYCGVTENTETVLRELAVDRNRLAKLETLEVPDVPRILVRRRGETEFANLASGLSQGEQSAAILTMALQTRKRPLVIDQPEDELGYSYVVHLIVPKILQVKLARQLLIITHNANIPVLGDSDYVTRIQNQPNEYGGRRCAVAVEGCFESSQVTTSLLELDGGRRAFEFRQYRYALGH